MMLDAVIDYLPSPLDIPSIEGHLKTARREARHTNDSEPFAALAFKVTTDPFVGRLTYFRVYSGTATAGSYVLNATKDTRERFRTYRSDARESPCGNHGSLRG